jgi:hypothetical protein
MASVLRNLKQVPSSAFFVNLADIRANVLINYGASYDLPLLSSASWVQGTNTISSISTALAAAGKAFLRDMGLNLVSANRTFRKVQMLDPSTRALSTGGVTGTASGAVNGDYLTGYIELPGTQGNVSGNQPTTAVARVG